VKLEIARQGVENLLKKGSIEVDLRIFDGEISQETLRL
jgi:hypothetical protein